VTLRFAFLLRPDVVFLNHGSYGACPRPVFEAYQAWQRELELQPVEFLGRRSRGLLRSAREALAAYVGAGPDELAFMPNATTALNTVARALPLAEGDEVLGTDHEYGAMERTWEFMCRRSGARYVRQPVPVPVTSPQDVVDAVWEGVTPRTRVLFISHITSPTAITFPAAALVRRARESGITSVVDGAHVPGQRPLDLRALGADFYVGNCHKWLCTPKGSGFLYAGRDVQPQLTPLVISWGWREDGPVTGLSEALEAQGTRDIAAFLSVPAAIAFQEQHDWPRVQAECHALLGRVGSAIGALTGLPPLAPESDEWYAQMAAFPLPPCDAARLKERLYDEYTIEVPIVTWRDRQFVRVSVQAYNDWSDLNTLVEALSRLLPQTMTES
jgi:isopenicillin-N epimerase